MITSVDQIAAIDLVAAKLQGLDTLLWWTMIFFMVFGALVFMIQNIVLDLQSKCFAELASNGNNNNTPNNQTVQEDTMANNAEQEEKTETTAATPVVVTEITLRGRTHEIVDAAFDKVESIRDGITARWSSVKSWFSGTVDRTKELAEDAVIAGAWYLVVAPICFVEEKIEDYKAKAEAKANAKAKAEAEAEAERIHKLREEVGYYDLKQKLEAIQQQISDSKKLKQELAELEEKNQSLEEDSEKLSLFLQVVAENIRPADAVEVPEATALKLRLQVEELIAEAEEILEADRAGALAILRNSDVARAYNVRTDLTFIQTKNRLLKLIA